MTHENMTPAYPTAGIRMMGRMFEQQVRIAQVFGECALGSSMMLVCAPVKFKAAVAPDGSVHASARPTRAPSAPRRMPEIAARTHSMPV